MKSFRNNIQLFFEAVSYVKKKNEQKKRYAYCVENAINKLNVIFIPSNCISQKINLYNCLIYMAVCGGKGYQCLDSSIKYPLK